MMEENMNHFVNQQRRSIKKMKKLIDKKPKRNLRIESSDESDIDKSNEYSYKSKESDDSDSKEIKKIPVLMRGLMD